MSIVAAWDGGETAERHIDWVEAFWSGMEPFVSSGVYANFLGNEGEGRVQLHTASTMSGWSLSRTHMTQPTSSRLIKISNRLSVSSREDHVSRQGNHSTVVKNCSIGLEGSVFASWFTAESS